MKIPFLTAYWQDLVVVNYEINPKILSRYIPRGTELDLFEGRAYVSLIAFCFNKNKLFGLIPTYPAYSFEEVNLRFYVKRGEHRAVTFIKEVVPSKLIASTAKFLYNEPYVAMKTLSQKVINSNNIKYSYAWGSKLEHSILVVAEKKLRDLEHGSIEEFILEHYWGYTLQPDASTVEYHVSHPRWKFHKVESYELSDNIKMFYGSEFQETLSTKPNSIFVAEGSKVSVSTPRKFFQPLSSNTP